MNTGHYLPQNINSFRSQFDEEYSQSISLGENSASSAGSGRQGFIARTGAVLASATRRATGAIVTDRPLPEQQRIRNQAFAAFCRSHTINLLRNLQVTNAENLVTSINLPRFVLVLTGPYMKLSLRKALWFASFALYTSPTGNITGEIIANVLRGVGKIVDGRRVELTEEEIVTIMDLAEIQYSGTVSRINRMTINDRDLPGDGFVVPDVSAGFSFEYIVTHTASLAINGCTDVCRDILSGIIPNVQELDIPLIKGPSGCGKTRLGREIALSIIRMAGMNEKKAVHILRRMDLLPTLHSQSFIDRQTNEVNGNAMLLANLVCLSNSVPGALEHSRTPNITFDLHYFLHYTKSVCGIDMILFQIDEYRQDLNGSTAMLLSCVNTIISDQYNSVTKVYPIITGMTSYVEVVDDAIGRSSGISGYMGTAPYNVGTLQGPDRADMERQLLDVIAENDELTVDYEKVSTNVWWSQLMHDIGGHARYYKFVANMVRRTGSQLSVVSGTVSIDDCVTIAEGVINNLRSISKPANWRSLISRQISRYNTMDIQYDVVGEITKSVLRRFIVLAITKYTITNHAHWEIPEVDGHPVHISLEMATHTGLIGYQRLRHDATVDISRLLIAALNHHCDAILLPALSLSDNDTDNHAAVVESFRMRLCAGLTAALGEDALFITDARPVCIAQKGTDLRLQSSAQLWDLSGSTKHVNRYTLKSWPNNGSLPQSVYFKDFTYEGWCGLSYFLNYNNPPDPVIVVHLLPSSGHTVSDVVDWVSYVLKELFAWPRWPTDMKADVVVDIIFSVPDGRIVLPAATATATTTSAPIPIRQGTGATARTAMRDGYDNVREQQKAAIATSLDNLQFDLKADDYIDAFQNTIPDNLSFSVKAITAAIASGYFPVRDIFEQYRTGRRRR